MLANNGGRVCVCVWVFARLNEIKKNLHREKCKAEGEFLDIYAADRKYFIKLEMRSLESESLTSIGSVFANVMKIEAREEKKGANRYHQQFFDDIPRGPSKGVMRFV